MNKKENAMSIFSRARALPVLPRVLFFGVLGPVAFLLGMVLGVLRMPVSLFRALTSGDTSSKSGFQSHLDLDGARMKYDISRMKAVGASMRARRTK